MYIKTIDHVALMVNDIERSLHFYRDLLGLEVASPEEHINKPWVDEMVGMSNVHAREYRFRARGGVNGYTRAEGDAELTFDIIQWVAPESPSERYPINHVPSAHFCFGVEDIWSIYERLKAEGVEFVSPPVRYTGDGEWHVLFFYDPDGNLLEFNEIGTGQQQLASDHEYDWSDNT
mgnify:CR=1 FL=1